MASERTENRLIREKSPYLLQHARNPVDWYPWGAEAFEKAMSEDKPVFLSVGYSTCHWCHVMEKESFEDSEVAEALNRDFIAIKVDREERPDLDSIYMAFCQLMTGRGGWPLSVFMAPDGTPFFAATYIPKLPKYGQAGLLQLLSQIRDAWASQRDELLSSGGTMLDALRKAGQASSAGLIEADLPDRVFRTLARSFDETYGGFGREPKFPSPHILFFLLRYYLSNGNGRALAMAERTLEGMYRGGLFDHVGFGFSRYSTDRRWLVPHFEKMLYDNALLALAYAEAHAVTGKPLYRAVAEKVLQYVLRDMQAPEGGFFSAEDADSEGEEGRFYVFDPEEIDGLAGEVAEEFKRFYGIAPGGNFEGRSIPNLLDADSWAGVADEGLPDKLEAAREKVFEYRAQRQRPFKDDKILTSWNGMMIAALAFAGRTFGRKDYIDAAVRAARSVIDHAIGADRRLRVGYRDGEASMPGYLDDYVFMVWGAIELYEATLDGDWLEKAVVWSRDMIRLFWDEELGCFFMTGSDADELILRPKEFHDGAVPSGNSAAAMVLMRLGALTEDDHYIDIAYALAKSNGAKISKNPASHIHFVSAYLCTQTGIASVLVSGHAGEKKTTALLREMTRKFYPFAVYKHEEAGPGEPAVAVVCRRNTCSAPVTDVKGLRRVLAINR